VLRFPVAAKVEADNLSARFGGWRTSTGVLLRQPLASTINFTPALAKCAPRAFYGRVSDRLDSKASTINFTPALAKCAPKGVCG